MFCQTLLFQPDAHETVPVFVSVAFFLLSSRACSVFRELSTCFITRCLITEPDMDDQLLGTNSVYFKKEKEKRKKLFTFPVDTINEGGP